MAISLRTIQSALNGSGMSVNDQRALSHTRILALQNYLTAATGNSNNSATLQDVIVSGRTDCVLGSCLQLELGEDLHLTSSNIWYIEAHVVVSTAATQGIKMQVTAYDGLVFDTSTDFAPFVNFTFNVNTTAGAAIAGTTSVAPGSSASFQSASGNAVTADITGLVRVKNYGRIGLQFAQSVATAANTSITAGYIIAESVLI